MSGTVLQNVTIPLQPSSTGKHQIFVFIDLILDV